jgi:hypothetical protein
MTMASGIFFVLIRTVNDSSPQDLKKAFEQRRQGIGGAHATRICEADRG